MIRRIAGVSAAASVPPPNSIVVVQQTSEARNSLGTAFSRYVAELIDELDGNRRDEVQEYILSYIFNVKQLSRQQQAVNQAAM